MIQGNALVDETKIGKPVEEVSIGEVSIDDESPFPTMLHVSKPSEEGKQNYIRLSGLPKQMQDAIIVLIRMGQIR